MRPVDRARHSPATSRGRLPSRPARALRRDQHRGSSAIASRLALPIRSERSRRSCAGHRRAPAGSNRLLLGAQRGVLLLEALASLVRHLEVSELEDLPDLDLAIPERRALEPLDRLLERLALPDPVARDDLLALAERTVDHLLLWETHARPLGRRVQAVAREHDARLDELV